ncbi:helix-turn-helix domain-containing protein [uncultured Croceitalea sp.]|uniref:helix-turn-helix domain-containing protein n=1 Tax=uncultured Croceitalea sp. TaxID=1798908 RepID=UPI00374EFC96
MSIKFDYPHRTREDYLKDVVFPMVKRRKDLGLTQEDVNHQLGVADYLVAKWERGLRTPLTFHLYCWAHALEGQIVFMPKEFLPLSDIEGVQSNFANDNKLLSVVTAEEKEKKE